MEAKSSQLLTTQKHANQQSGPLIQSTSSTNLCHWMSQDRYVFSPSSVFAAITLYVASQQLFILVDVKCDSRFSNGRFEGTNHCFIFWKNVTHQVLKQLSVTTSLGEENCLVDFSIQTCGNQPKIVFISSKYRSYICKQEESWQNHRRTLMKYQFGNRCGLNLSYQRASEL